MKTQKMMLRKDMTSNYHDKKDFGHTNKWVEK